MEAEDILADKMQGGGPEVSLGAILEGVADGGDVVGKGIEPHVDDVLVVARHGDAPGEGSPRYGQVLESSLLGNKADYLVPSALGSDEVGMPGVEVEQRLRPLRQPEEVRLLLHPLHLGARGSLPFDELTLRVEGLVPNRVPALVSAEVDVSLVLELLPEGFHRLHVSTVCCPYEVVGRAVEAVTESSEHRRDLVRELNRRLLAAGRTLLHLLAVLVRPGQEEHLPAVLAVEPGDGVSGDSRVGVSEVRQAVHVVDWGADEVGRGGGRVKPRGRPADRQSAQGTEGDHRREGEQGGQQTDQQLRHIPMTARSRTREVGTGTRNWR